MKDRHDNFLVEAANVTLAVFVSLLVLGWALSTRLGGFLLLTLLATTGSILVIGVLSDMVGRMVECDFTLANNGWFYAVCFLGSAIFSLGYMSVNGMLRKD